MARKADSNKKSKTAKPAATNPRSRFSEKRLTSRAGLIPISRFMKKLKFDQILEKTVQLPRGENSHYGLGMIYRIIILGITGGCRHLSDLVQLQNDEAVMKVQSWNRFPVVSTIIRVLERFTFPRCVELSEAQSQMRQKIWAKKWHARVNLDLDSSSKSVYGHQEGVEFGHNTERSHKKMLNPIFAFIAQTGECLHTWLRPGNTFSANGSSEFLKECLAMLPKRAWRVVVRADSAFFSGDFIRELAAQGCGYIIKVKTRGWKKLCARQSWRKARGQEGVWTTEFRATINGYENPICFFAIRRLERIETEGLLIPIPIYKYSLFVSNLPGTPIELERFYNKRAVAENLIGVGKNQMAFGSMLVHEFWANHALLQAAVLAYNIMVWFQRLILDKRRWSERPNTLRVWLIYLAARLLLTDGKWVLALARGYPYQEEWRQMEARLEALAL